jgi:hypothetical protein
MTPRKYEWLLWLLTLLFLLAWWRLTDTEDP